MVHMHYPISQNSRYLDFFTNFILEGEKYHDNDSQNGINSFDFRPS